MHGPSVVPVTRFCSAAQRSPGDGWWGSPPARPEMPTHCWRLHPTPGALAGKRGAPPIQSPVRKLLRHSAPGAKARPRLPGGHSPGLCVHGLWGRGGERSGPDALLPLHKMCRGASSTASLPPSVNGTGSELRGVEQEPHTRFRFALRLGPRGKKAFQVASVPWKQLRVTTHRGARFAASSVSTTCLDAGLDGTSGWHWHGLPAISTHAGNDAQMLLPRLAWASLPHWFLWRGTAALASALGPRQSLMRSLAGPRLTTGLLGPGLTASPAPSLA